VERSDTHLWPGYEDDGFRDGSTHPTRCTAPFTMTSIHDIDLRAHRFRRTKCIRSLSFIWIALLVPGLRLAQCL